MVRQVRESDPSRWYSMLKRISKHDKDMTEQLNVDEIAHLTDQDQAEAIAEHINKISMEYEEVKENDINIPEFSPDTIPSFKPWQIKKNTLTE